MRSFVIGDIHGKYIALEQCLERAGFNDEKDRLICLGDVADRGDYVPLCIERLMKIKHLIYVMGNHDIWLKDWFQYNIITEGWLCKGGENTINAYKVNDHMCERHLDFLYKAKDYYLDEQGRLFIHAGINQDKDFSENDLSDFSGSKRMWKNLKTDPTNVTYSLNNRTDVINKNIFIGHSQTSGKYPDLEPVRRANVWNLDQGAGKNGKLTIMNVDTMQFWQSDKVDTLSL